jgi:hypothetical protein
MSNPLRPDQSIVTHDSPVPEGLQRMYAKSLAPRLEPVIPAGADRETIRAARMFPSLYQSGPKVEPVAPPTREEIRLARMFPTVKGIQPTEAQAAAAKAGDPIASVNFAAPSYGGFAGFAQRNNLSAEAQRELLRLHAQAKDEDGDDAEDEE